MRSTPRFRASAARSIVAALLAASACTTEPPDLTGPDAGNAGDALADAASRTDADTEAGLDAAGDVALDAPADAPRDAATDAPRCPEGGCPCTDSCPAPRGGVRWGCEKRFVYGTNWGWRNFGGDFGGVTAYGWRGVSVDPGPYATQIQQMKAAGVNVIRWWMFPRFRTDAIRWTNGAPSGIAGTLLADVQAALRLADEHDVYLMLTPFSFDNFYPTRSESGVNSPGIRPIVLDATRRASLLRNLIAPIARAVEASPYRHRMLAWDMINEPEWAMTGPSLYGGEAFDPQATLETVTHTQMQLFLREMAASLRANSRALVTIGGAAIKWARAWTGVDVDFYQYHYYDWVYESFPYTTVTLQSVGMTSKPVVMGEFPMQGLSAIPSRRLPARTAAQLSADLWNQGYAGALAWSFQDPDFPFDPSELRAFVAQHPCETQY